MEDEKPLIFVSVLDDAIDQEAMTLADKVRYFETRDQSILKLLPGKRPQFYHCREVPQSRWESYVLVDGISEAERYRRAFQCGVVEVHNVLQRDGSILPSWKPTEQEIERGIMLDENVAKFSANDRSEIGACIFERSFLAPRTVRVYPLPLTSRQRLAERAFLPADAIPPSPASSSASASSAATPARSDATTPAPSNSDGATDSATAATAQASTEVAA